MKISVVTSAYNAEKYIEQCANSVLAQTYKNIEWLVVDDGSTDSTLSILEGIAKKDSRVKIINQNNQGPSAGRNNGIKEISGEWFLFVDADDLLHPQLVETCVDTVNQTGVELLSFDYTEFSREQSVLIKEISHSEVKVYENPLAELKKSYPINATACNKFYKTQKFKNIEYPVGINIAEDMAYSWEVRAIATKIAKIDNLFYFYRKGHESLSEDGVTDSFLKGHYYLVNQLSKTYINSQRFDKLVQDYINKEIASICYKMFFMKVKKLPAQNPIKKQADGYLSELLETSVFQRKYLPLKKQVFLWFALFFRTFN